MSPVTSTSSTHGDSRTLWTVTSSMEESIVTKSVVYRILRRYVYHAVTPGFMILGVVGNAACLYVATRFRRRQSALERSAVVALVALALSDLLFCLVGLPQLFCSGWPLTNEVNITATSNTEWRQSVDIDQHQSLRRGYQDSHHHHLRGEEDQLTRQRLAPAAAAGEVSQSVAFDRFKFYYRLYRGALHNVFLFSSTWIIVVMSAERCLLVVRPIQARLLTIRAGRSAAVYIGVFLMSVAVSSPLFMMYLPVDEQCSPSYRCMYVVPTELVINVVYKRVYHFLLLTVGTLVPAVCLLVTGVSLVRVVRARRNEHRLGASQRTPCFRSDDADSAATSVRLVSCSYRVPRPSPVTPTVVANVTSYLALVCPSMVVTSIGLIVGVQNFTDFQMDVYESSIIVTNFCQVVKCAGNFFVYFRLVQGGCPSMPSTFRNRSPATATLPRSRPPNTSLSNAWQETDGITEVSADRSTLPPVSHRWRGQPEMERSAEGYSSELLRPTTRSDRTLRRALPTLDAARHALTAL